MSSSLNAKESRLGRGVQHPNRALQNVTELNSSEKALCLDGQLRIGLFPKFRRTWQHRHAGLPHSLTAELAKETYIEMPTHCNTIPENLVT